MDRIKILFLAANPACTDLLQLQREAREIREKIRASASRDQLELTTWWEARPDDLQQALLEIKPHILHFSGHGNKSGQIIFQDDQGNSRPIDSEALKHLLTILKDNIRLVLLNACYSRPQAEAITEHIDCAIGMGSAIGDVAAIEFAGAFYRAIAFGRNAEEAFELGRSKLMLAGIPEHNTPELLTRTGIEPSELILAHPAQKSEESNLHHYAMRALASHSTVAFRRSKKNVKIEDVFIEPKCEQFQGNDTVPFRLTSEYLSRNNTLLLGPPGSGKSFSLRSFFVRSIREVRTNKHSTVPILFRWNAEWISYVSNLSSSSERRAEYQRQLSVELELRDSDTISVLETTKIRYFIDLDFPVVGRMPLNFDFLREAMESLGGSRNRFAFASSPNSYLLKQARRANLSCLSLLFFDREDQDRMVNQACNALRLSGDEQNEILITLETDRYTGGRNRLDLPPIAVAHSIEFKRRVFDFNPISGRLPPRLASSILPKELPFELSRNVEIALAKSALNWLQGCPDRLKDERVREIGINSGLLRADGLQFRFDAHLTSFAAQELKSRLLKLASGEVHTLVATDSGWSALYQAFCEAFQEVSLGQAWEFVVSLIGVLKQARDLCGEPNLRILELVTCCVNFMSQQNADVEGQLPTQLSWLKDKVFEHSSALGVPCRLRLQNCLGDVGLSHVEEDLRNPSAYFSFGVDGKRIYVSKYPVTNSQYFLYLSKHRAISVPWKRVGGTVRSRENPVAVPKFLHLREYNRRDQPVVGVSYTEALAFCRHVGGRLPSVGEWRSAAKACTSLICDTLKRASPALPDEIELATRGHRFDTPFPVGIASPGDFAGNVWQWCTDTIDRRDSYADRDGIVFSEDFIADGKAVVGGYARLWSESPSFFRDRWHEYVGAAHREGRFGSVGFRVVRDSFDRLEAFG